MSFGKMFWRVIENQVHSQALIISNTEYVKPGQTMYRITERTTVTIIVNPQNVKAPIYRWQTANNVRAYFDETALKNISSALPNIRDFKLTGLKYRLLALDMTIWVIMKINNM